MFFNLDDDKNDSITFYAGEYLEVELIRNISIMQVSIMSPLTGEIYREYISNRDVDKFYKENNLWRITIDTSWMEYSNYDLVIRSLDDNHIELQKFITLSVRR